ncbi:MAG: peptidase M14 [Blastocatellia bacterium]|nr:peptidase M14 [Chloracidobacterium sp.]MBL8186253.1 peptidase M14 [Blastocatellia bacterium]HBE82051.1 peptidase M14 [Blastocatellia bacterium]HRJ88757.1 M14 family zinc carboxypeptidase [Pyrinomonadaceae bacterium]HRK48797.1 M14 family zinc carboxypeptidase [Pyrinomonadaceae bacterium]
MRFVSTLALGALIFAMQTFSQTPAQLAEIWDKEHVTNKLPSNLRHQDLKLYLDGLLKLGLKVNEVGRSNANREIYQIEWGKGPLKIFLWSQMHGDEPTATSALIDMFTVLEKNRDQEWAKRIAEKVTIRAVPMLNPDGAEVFIRRNLQGIDINRDALDLKTPEGRLLKQLRDSWQPEIGFNLHNQQALTAAGQTDKQAAISFLVVYGDEAKTPSDGHERNKRIVAAMIQALNQFIPGHIARYDDEWTPTAFGDNFSKWGTPVILIETGGLHGKDEMYLVKMNFVAMMTALKVVADGTEKDFSPSNYEYLPSNSGRRLMNIVFRGGTVIDVATAAGAAADIGINLERRRAAFVAPAMVRAVGSISMRGLDEYDASNFHIVGRIQPIKPGNFAELLFYKRDRQIDWKVPDIEKEFPPDAILSLGKWIKGAGVVPKR